MTTKQNSHSFVLAPIPYLLILLVSDLPINAENVSKCVVSCIYFIVLYQTHLTLCIPGYKYKNIPNTIQMDCISHSFNQIQYRNESHHSLCRDKGFQVRAHHCVVQDCTVIETLSKTTIYYDIMPTPYLHSQLSYF